MTVLLICDDEEPARDELSYILSELWPEAAQLQAANGNTALMLLATHRVDILFLDINMPEKDGLAVAAELLNAPNAPRIVFATAYDQYALKAFELAAADYVVKPFDERRLAKTVARLKAQQPSAETQTQQLHATLQQLLNQPKAPARLWAERDNGNRLLLDYTQIYWIEAKDKKVFVHTAEQTLLVRYTLKQLSDRLIPHHFVQIHRAYIVNISHIVELVPWFNGSSLLRMGDAASSELPVSRRYLSKLQSMID